MRAEPRPRCLCGHPAARHHAPTWARRFDNKDPLVCYEFDCSCHNYRPPHPRAPYPDGVTADGAGRIGRLVRLVEQGRFS